MTVWRDLGKVTAQYLDSKTLADIVSDKTRTSGVTDWHPKDSRVKAERKHRLLIAPIIR